MPSPLSPLRGAQGRGQYLWPLTRLAALATLSPLRGARENASTFSFTSGSTCGAFGCYQAVLVSLCSSGSRARTERPSASWARDRTRLWSAAEGKRELSQAK